MEGEIKREQFDSAFQFGRKFCGRLNGGTA
jgi:hypothetical protein